MISVSIIVPVYNVEKYLHECVSSIQKQTLSDFECVLVDDGSTDSSGMICDEIVAQDSRFRVIHKKNGGLSDARNAGLAVVEGKYVGFIDSDDWIESDMFQAMFSSAEKNGLDVISCDIRVVDEITHQSSLRKELCAFCKDDEVVNWSTVNDLLAALNNISVCNKFFSREFLHKIQFIFPVGVRYEDIIFWSRAFFKAERIGCLSRAFYNYRVSREGSIVQEKDYRALVNSYEIKINALNQHGALRKVKDDLISFLVLRLVYCFVRSKKEYRAEFYSGMQRLIRECGSYTFHSQHNILIRFFVWCYTIFSHLPYPLFSFLSIPFFLLCHFSALSSFRRKMKLG